MGFDRSREYLATGAAEDRSTPTGLLISATFFFNEINPSASKIWRNPEVARSKESASHIGS
jgi:hypothetical protein